MDWSRDLPDWPHAALSVRMDYRPHRWHVQQAGSGPTVLLIHGAGGATHSWRGVLPLLTSQAHVVALDLPGQGFTRAGTRQRSGLDPTAQDIAALARAQGWRPAVVVGHSAGAAVALRLSSMLSNPAGDMPRVVGINPALGKFDGLAGWLFPVLAKALSFNPLTPWLFTLGASAERARALIEGTGSRLDPEGYALYSRLMNDRDHVAGTLQMMAAWSLDGLLADLPRLPMETLFLLGEHDSAVPPRVGQEATNRMPRARSVLLSGLGHLAHEEAPEPVARHILDFATAPRPGALSA